METRQQTHLDIFQANCLSRHVLGLIADQWTPLVIYALEDGTKMLTQTLWAMERNGLVQRVVYPVMPPVVEYSLTPLGQTLIHKIFLRSSLNSFLKLVCLTATTPYYSSSYEMPFPFRFFNT
jgi:DNA-binding HxlR family transcriptional regulator